MKINRIYNLAIVCIAFLGLGLYSCVQDDQQLESFNESANVDFRGFGSGSEDCFTLVYPVTLIFPDETEVEVTSRGRTINVILFYKSRHPGEPFEPTIKFPYEVRLEKNGRVIQILDVEDEEGVLRDCQTDPEDPQVGNCYEIIYPVTLLFPNGTSKRVENKEEFDQVMKKWNNDNPGAVDRPRFELPYSVILRNGTVKRVETLRDQQELNARCRIGDRPKTQGEKFINDRDN
jgi:hypothetical protein